VLVIVKIDFKLAILVILLLLLALKKSFLIRRISQILDSSLIILARPLMQGIVIVAFKIVVITDKATATTLVNTSSVGEVTISVQVAATTSVKVTVTITIGIAIKDSEQHEITDSS